MMHRKLFHGLITGFCIWHMAAVAFYSIPVAANDRVSVWLKNEVKSHFFPYMFITSQWQQWNLFSPDPLRRVVRLRVERTDGGPPRFVGWIAPETTPFFSRADLFKALLTLNGNDMRMDPILAGIAGWRCGDVGLSPNTPMRITVESFVEPYPEAPLTFSEWRSFSPSWTTERSLPATCLDV